MMQTKRAMRGIRISLVAAAAATFLAGEAKAQVAPDGGSIGASRAFFNIGAGAQPLRQTIEINPCVAEPGLCQKYGETGTITGTQHIGNGPIVDFNGGYRVWRNLSIGVGVSSFSKEGESTVTASIPHPLFFDQFKTSTQTATALEHGERTVYVQALWFIPITDKVDVAVGGGPAFVRITQGFISAFSVPAGTQNLTIATSTQTATATGGIVGVDGTYLITRNIGAGLFVRYLSASTTIAGFGDLKAGGFHAGLGARVRF